MLGVGGKSKAGNTIHKEANSSAVSSVSTETGTVNLIGQDSHQQQFDTPSSLIGAHQWPHRLCSGLSWFYRVSKRPPVKEDLAIYSPINGVSAWIVLECGFHVKL